MVVQSYGFLSHSELYFQLFKTTFFTTDPYIYMAKTEKKLHFPAGVCLICLFAAVVSVKGGDFYAMLRWSLMTLSNA